MHRPLYLLRSTRLLWQSVIKGWPSSGWHFMMLLKHLVCSAVNTLLIGLVWIGDELVCKTLQVHLIKTFGEQILQRCFFEISGGEKRNILEKHSTQTVLTMLGSSAPSADTEVVMPPFCRSMLRLRTGPRGGCRGLAEAERGHRWHSGKGHSHRRGPERERNRVGQQSSKGWKKEEGRPKRRGEAVVVDREVGVVGEGRKANTKKRELLEM